MHSSIQKRDKKKTVKKVIKKHLKDKLLIKTAQNAVYNKEQILNPVFGAISSKEFIESYVEDLREDRKKVPSGDCIFYRLGDLSLNNVTDCYNSTTEEILSKANQLDVFDRPIARGIDWHDTPWYGKDDKYMVGAERIRGTNYAHRYMSIELLEQPRFTIHAVPMNQFKNRAECLKELLLNAKRWLKKGGINHLDRGFFNSPMINVLYETKEDFVIAAKRNLKIDRLIKERKPFANVVPYEFVPGNLRQEKAIYSYHVERYTMEEGKIPVTFNLVFLFTQYQDPNKKDDIFLFATNLKITDRNILVLSEGYRKRWGIETGYRVKKEVHGKTNSPNYVIRVLFQLLSILLYNLWVLCNLLLSEIVPTRKVYSISMNGFRKILNRYVVDIESIG